MYLKSLQLKNFRNYKSASVSFDSGLNVLKGENASGKTNLVEAVYLLGLGKSPRTANEKELIKIGEEHAYVKAVVQKNTAVTLSRFLSTKAAKNQNRRHTRSPRGRTYRRFKRSLFQPRRAEIYKRRPRRKKKIFRYSSFTAERKLFQNPSEIQQNP